MKLSIIIPVYQVEAFIFQCLSSLCCETRTDTEIIVVNDGSTDQSEDEIMRYKQAYEPVHFTYIKQENAGLSEARNAGLKASKGEYVFFMDGDDWLAKHAVASIHTCLNSNPDMLVFDVWKSYVHLHMHLKGCEFVPDKEYTFAEAMEYTFQGKMMVSACLKVWKKTLFNEPPFAFPKGMWYEDLQLIKLYLDHPKARVYYTPQPFYHYRQREGSITHTFTDKVFDKYILLERISQWMHDKQVAEVYPTSFQAFYLRAMIIEMANSLATSAHDRSYQSNMLRRIFDKPLSKVMRPGYMRNRTLTFMQKGALTLILHATWCYLVLFKWRFLLRQKGIRL